MTTTQIEAKYPLVEACCPDPPAWSSRPKFNPGQELTAQALTTGFADQLGRLRLLNRTVHGHGIVHGFALEEKDGRLDTDGRCITVSAGLALDGRGRMLVWPGGVLALDFLSGDKPSTPGQYTLYAHYGQRLVPGEGCPPCGPEARWTEEGVVFSIHCGCTSVDDDCPDHPDGTCLTHHDYLAQRTGSVDHGPGRLPIAHDLTPVEQGPGHLYPSGCDGWRYDPDRTVAVPLACIEVCDINDGESDCEPDYRFATTPPDLRVRPYVYRLPLLYELLNCCDVNAPKVRHLTWFPWVERGWDRPVRWRRFRRRARVDAEPDDGFTVYFSKPVDPDTLHPGSVFMAVITRERPKDYWRSDLVPTEVVPVRNPSGDSIGAQLIPHRDWFRSELSDSFSGLDHGFRVEITVRGQIIRDLCGVPLDARPIDLPDDVRCQARPGDDYVTTFQVRGRNRHDDGDHGDEGEFDDYEPDGDEEYETSAGQATSDEPEAVDSEHRTTETPDDPTADEADGEERN